MLEKKRKLRGKIHWKETNTLNVEKEREEEGKNEIETQRCCYPINLAHIFHYIGGEKMKIVVTFYQILYNQYWDNKSLLRHQAYNNLMTDKS